MRNPGLLAFVGAAGGGGFTWILQHAPIPIAAVLAVAATIGLVRTLWIIHRGILQSDKELAEHMAFIERMRQSWKAGSN